MIRAQDFCSDECNDRWDAHWPSPDDPDPSTVRYNRKLGRCNWCWGESRAALAERLAKEEG